MQRPKPRNAYYCPDSAEEAVYFIETCCVHPKGELTGSPFVLEDWQKKELIEPLFGWRDEETGDRKFTALLFSVPRKNGKTVICAAISLYLLLVEQAGTAPEIVSIATADDQARIVLAMAKAICRKSPLLNSEVKIYQNKITPMGEPNAYMKALTRDGSSKHGLSPSAGVCDEIAQYQPAIGAKLLEAVETGFAERRSPLAMYISTVGSNYTSNLFANYWNYAKKVSNGAIRDDRFLPCIYGADEEDDWTSPDVWRKANPNIGISVRESFIKDQCEKAIARVELQPSFKTYHLNMWVKTSKAWLDIRIWDKGADPVRVGDGRRCWGGLDLSSSSDLTAFAIVFEPDADNYVDVLLWFWVPEDTLNHSPYSRFYRSWVESGDIIAMGGAVINHDGIKNEIVECDRKFGLESVGIDRWSSAQIRGQLEESHNIATVGIGMGYASMAAAVDYAERLTNSNRIRHGGQPVLRWCIDNTVISMDPSGNKKPDKARSSAKIDGTVALLLALKNMDDSLLESTGIWGETATIFKPEIEVEVETNSIFAP